MSRILFLLLPNKGWDGKLHPLRFPHTGVGYLAAYLKKHGVEVRVEDTSLDYAHHEMNIRRAIESFSPDLVGITVYSNLVPEGRAAAAAVQKVTTVPIVAGGPHISVTNKEFLEQTGARFGIMRDGEKPLLKLIAALSNGGKDEELGLIPGLIFKDRNGKFAIRENTDLIQDLDEIPFPDLSVFEMEKYRAWRSKQYEIITSRGCPYACTYCSAPLVTGRKFRFRSAKNVVDEMELYARKGIKKFGIMDDAFNVNLDRAKDVCRLIIERQLNITWDMGNGMRANSVDKEFFQLLKKAGCNFVGFGLESGNDEMLKKIKKGLTISQMYEALKYAREVGIGTAVNFIIGHPGETYETAMDTIRLAEKLPASYVNVYGLQPFAGTEADRVLRDSEREGKAKFLYDQEYYLSHFSPQGIEPVFETDELSKDQRRKLLVLGRSITKRRALEYRFGKVLGRCLYVFLRNEAIFAFVNNLRFTAAGARLYGKIRHED